MEFDYKFLFILVLCSLLRSSDGHLTNEAKNVNEGNLITVEEIVVLEPE